MTDQSTIDARLSALQSEAKDLSAQRRRKPARQAGRGEAAKPDVEEVAEGSGSLHTQLEELAEAFETRVEDLANDAKDGFREHPVITMAAAFAIGILIGRLSK